MKREQKEVKLRMILQDYHRRNDYELQQAVNDILALDALPPAGGADSSKGDFDDVLKKERKCVCGAELKHRGGISFWCDNPHCKTAYVFDADGHISEYGTVEQKGTPRQTVGGAGHHFASKEIEQPTAEGAEEIHNIEAMQKCLHRYVNVDEVNRYDTLVFGAMRDYADDFATLHAQQIADKMVEERLMEELIKFFKWYGLFQYEDMTDEMIIDEYLKSRRP